MKLADFDFDLPEALIALRPAEPRDQARLLHVHGDQRDDMRVCDLPDLLTAGDVLVFNDTRVIPARLFGERLRDNSILGIEAILLQSQDEGRWTTLMRPGKRLRPGDLVRFRPRDPALTHDEADTSAILDATVISKAPDGQVTLQFDRNGPALDEAIRRIGVMPLPPYIAQKRAEDERDRQDYQTIFARFDGSVAAPTAGLHFTPELLQQLQDKGVQTAFVTLHVGAGTFLPVKADAIDDHVMHAEFGEVSAETAEFLNEVRARGGRIIGVGTTSTRLLETAAQSGILRAYRGQTDIYIRPGYRFRAIDGLITNFHLPRSTLLMLLSALAGHDRMHAAYRHAIANGYRFYSYGDAGLWWPKGTR